MASPDQFRRLTPQPARSAGVSGGFLIATLLAVAFGVGIAIAGYFLMAAKGDVSDAVISATLRASAPAPSASQADIEDSSWTDADIRACKDRATAAGEAARQRKLVAVSSGRVGLGGPDPAVIERATYLLCGATQKPRHLCKGYWKSWFIKAIREHAIDFRTVSSTAYWTKVNVAEQAQRDAGQTERWKAIGDDLDQTTREVARMHEEIIDAFRRRIGDGVVKAEAFGKFLGLGIPPEIKAMIGDARPLRDICA